MIKKISIIFLYSAAMVLVGCAGVEKKQTNAALVEPKSVNIPVAKADDVKKRPLADGTDLLLRSMISGIVMQDLDQSDENLARLSAMRALEMSPDGVPQSWRNPNTDKYGQSVVTQTMTTNRNCRMLSSVAYDAFGFKLGDEKVNYCRDANGKWVPVK